jgi:hypothetical protein
MADLLGAGLVEGSMQHMALLLQSPNGAGVRSYGDLLLAGARPGLLQQLLLPLQLCRWHGGLLHTSYHLNASVTTMQQQQHRSRCSY